MQREVLLVVILAFVTATALGQEHKQLRGEFVAAAKDSTTAQQVVQQAPEYVGGFGALYAYVLSNLHYSAKAAKAKKPTKAVVRVSFIVDRTDGHVRDMKVEKGASKKLDAEALRIVSSMPNWIPGKQSGENIDVQLTLPIEFNLP